MLPIPKKLQLIAIALACSLTAGVAINYLFATFPLTWKVTKTLNLFFYEIFFQPALRPPDSLVIIDSKDPVERRARAEYAEMIGRLHQAGAKCIALDIRFLGTRDSSDSRGDQALVDSVAKSPEVILSIDFSVDHPPSALQMVLAERLCLPDLLCQLLPEFDREGAALPFDRLLLVAKHLGHINTINNEYHHFPIVITIQRKCYAALPVEMARVYFASEGQPFELNDLPTDSEEQMLVTFIPVDEFAPSPYSWEDAIELLREQPARFRDTVIMIVNASAEPRIQTPIDANYPRWALLASFASQLLLNRHIETSEVFDATLYSTAMVFLSGIWLLFVFPRLVKKWRKMRLLFMAGTGLFLLLIFLLLRYGQLWIGVVVPVLVFNTSMLVVRARYYRMIRAPEPQYGELGLAVSESQNGIYSIQVFVSEVGEEEANPIFSSFAGDKTLQAILQKLKNLQTSKADLQALGEKLFAALFQNNVENILKNSLDKAKSENKILRLKLRLDAPELICLPWELMHSAKLPPGFIAFHKHLSLTRYLALEQSVPKSQFRIPMRVLVVMASPVDPAWPLLNVEEEKKIIKKALRSLVWSGDVRLRFCENATREKLMAELERQPHVLHFIGHGEFDAGKKEAFLILETETHEPDKVDAETLATLLQERSVNLVVLNSCKTAAAASSDAFTGMAQSLVRVGLPAVVAMQHKVRDDSALWFSNEFYSTLFARNSIDVAVAEARRYVMTKAGLNRQDWVAPVLFMRAHDGKIFEMES